MKKLIQYLLLLIGFCSASSLDAQSLETEIRVYDFADGLSHRNVFKILQDDRGLIWVATINGLNAFTGYGFERYNSSSDGGTLPNDLVSDFLLLPNDQLLLASPDFISHFSTVDQHVDVHQIKPGEIVRREALTPFNLTIDGNRIWCTVYDERNGQNWLARFENNQLELLRSLSGAGTKRPFINWRGRLFFAESDNQLILLAEDGTIQSVETVGEDATAENAHNIIALQERNNKLWILFDDGRIYYKPAPGAPAQKWLSGPPIKTSDRVESFWVEENQDIWVGGFGLLWQYDSKENIWRSFDEPIRQQLKNTCTYRQIFQDRMGTTWLSTDFGAIKINQSDRLFGNYLSGGSEYCSNVYCSMRGITEDEQGNIYLAYYNSIHVLKPDEQTVRPLFPKNDFFNFPFGITCHEDYLYTGNGIRIHLKTLQRSLLFPNDSKDLGAVIVDNNKQLWFGYEHQLYKYNPSTTELSSFTDNKGQWDSLSGTICQLYESPFNNDIWVGTMDNGAIQISDKTERTTHFSTTDTTGIRLPHNQVNAICETASNRLWLGTARGLVSVDQQADTSYVYTTKDGLPNNYINGILSEGDSCLWISTDNGLCRLSFKTSSVVNFF
ncbi:MAG: two-component regulator propeller domain-containing protein, partial [Bacteroidota bacterium]